mmetsp:Transcript_27487/g.64137  ORF Transcript_27487/g.64137 Transcript_27487/m.64137 type:complete len:457 (-) Transcript_27487:3798-5168(-)
MRIAIEKMRFTHESPDDASPTALCSPLAHPPSPRATPPSASAAARSTCADEARDGRRTATARCSAVSSASCASVASCISPSSKFESSLYSASLSAEAVACLGLVEGVSSAASRAREASRAPSSSIEQTSDMAMKMERSSSDASLHGCPRVNSALKADTFHSVCTTTLTKHECCPVLFSRPGAAAPPSATSSSAVVLASATACFPLRLEVEGALAEAVAGAAAGGAAPSASSFLARLRLPDAPAPSAAPSDDAGSSAAPPVGSSSAGASSICSVSLAFFSKPPTVGRSACSGLGASPSRRSPSAPRLGSRRSSRSSRLSSPSPSPPTAAPFVLGLRRLARPPPSARSSSSALPTRRAAAPPSPSSAGGAAASPSEPCFSLRPRRDFEVATSHVSATGASTSACRANSSASCASTTASASAASRASRATMSSNPPKRTCSSPSSSHSPSSSASAPSAT